MTDLRDLLGDDLEPGERERLERVHAMLVEAGPPPELPPALVSSPKPPKARVLPFPSRYRYTALAAAAIAALALFGLGYLVGGGPDPGPVRTVTMSGAGEASAVLDLFEKDTAGNWPMELRTDGLADGEYELWLTRGDELAEPCGVFAVQGDVTVPLNAPYPLRQFDGWVIVRSGERTPILTT